MHKDTGNLKLQRSSLLIPKNMSNHDYVDNKSNPLPQYITSISEILEQRWTTENHHPFSDPLYIHLQSLIILHCAKKK